MNISLPKLKRLHCLAILALSFACRSFLFWAPDLALNAEGWDAEDWDVGDWVDDGGWDDSGGCDDAGGWDAEDWDDVGGWDAGDWDDAGGLIEVLK